MTILHNGNGSANLSFLNQFDADDVQVGDVITLSIDGGTTYQADASASAGLAADAPRSPSTRSIRANSVAASAASPALLAPVMP